MRGQPPPFDVPGKRLIRGKGTGLSFTGPAAFILAIMAGSSATAYEITNTAYVSCNNEAGTAQAVVSSSTTFTVAAKPEQEGDIRVLVRIYDSSGRLVRTLLDRMTSEIRRVERIGDGDQRAVLRRGGILEIALSDGSVLNWDGRDDKGVAVPNGIYQVRAANLMPDGRLSVASASFSLTRPYEKLIESAILVPNPARDAVWISCRLASALGDVTAKIYAVSGELVHKSTVPVTGGSFRWDLRNLNGTRVAPGLYVVVLEAWDSWTQRQDRAIMKLAVDTAR